MKRRRLLQSLAGLPVAGALPFPAAAQQQARTANETPKLDLTDADAAAAGVPRYFTGDQFSALRRLCAIVAPAAVDNPGATEAGAAEFLDFLIGVSPPERQKLYREGLDHLNAEAGRRAGKSFADLADADADVILSPLRQQWTYSGPSDAFGQFLHAAKLDVLNATANSRESSLARAKRSRRAGGLGTYWYPVE